MNVKKSPKMPNINSLLVRLLPSLIKSVKQQRKKEMIKIIVADSTNILLGDINSTPISYGLNEPLSLFSFCRINQTPMAKPPASFFAFPFWN